MKRCSIHVFILAALISACASQPTITAEKPSPTEVTSSPTRPATSTPSRTPIPSPTVTDTPTITDTPSLPTKTTRPVRDCTPTISPTIEPTKRPTGESPGVQLHGYVSAPNGEAIAGAQIYYAFSAYPGNQLATTTSDGQYDGFIYIPHDETVRIWAEYIGYTFKPGTGNKSWISGEFAWHHYAGYEFVSLDFIGTPD